MAKCLRCGAGNEWLEGEVRAIKGKPLSIGWTVVGKYGVYYNSFSNLRKTAIAQHKEALGQTWAYCRKKGDRVVKTAIILRSAPTRRTR